MRCTSFCGLALRGNEVEPAPRQHLLGRHVENAAGQHVEAAKIVKQPAVEAVLDQGGLYSGKIEHSMLLCFAASGKVYYAPQTVRSNG